MLKRNRESLDRQTSTDWMQTFLHDNHGKGLHWANRNLGLYRSNLEGDYIWVLDDDDECISNTFIEDIGYIVAEHNPVVIMAKCDVDGHGVIPEPDYWQRAPIHSHIAMSGFVVKQDVWKKHARAFDEPIAADLAFISQVYQAVSTESVYWHDVVVMRTQRVSRGCPE